MGKGAQDDGEGWLQNLIAGGLSIGISKRELLEDYYIDEISEVIAGWNRLHNPDSDRIETVNAKAFLGDGGEVIDT